MTQDTMFKICTLFTLSNSPGLWSTTHMLRMGLRFMVKHQHHAHGFKLSKKKSTAPLGVCSWRRPTSVWSPPLLALPLGSCRSECMSRPSARAAGGARQLVELVSGLFLKVQKLKRQFFVFCVFVFCFAGSKAWGTGLYCSIWHTGRCF